MTEFDQFDSEPEDSWHPDDPIPDLLSNIVRRVALLRHTLGGVANQREQLRLSQIDEDLTFIIGRVRADG